MFPLNFFQLSFTVFSSLSYYFQLGDMKECQLKKMFHYAQYFCLTLRYTARVSGKYALVPFSFSFTFLEGLVFYFCEEFTDQTRLLLTSLVFFQYVLGSSSFAPDDSKKIHCNRYFLFPYCLCPVVNLSLS